MIFNPLNIIKYLKLKLKREEVYFDGFCHQCGKCCTHIYLFTGRGKIIKTKKQFERLCRRHPDSERFEIIGDDGGLVFKCTWLTEDGRCKDHENRLQLCKNYPAKVMYYTNFVTGDECGYKLRTGPSFANIFKKEVTKK